MPESIISQMVNLLFIYSTKKPTDKNKAKNWLPTPADGFRMTPRFMDQNIL